MSEPVTATLAQLATTHAGASRVLARHGLDFGCGGDARLADAARAAGLDPAAVLEEIAEEDRAHPAPEPWHERTVGEVVDGVLARYHAPLRDELPRLVDLARVVEREHAGAAPRGLAAHLEELLEGVLLHMQKEEEVLFPLLRQGRGAMALVPIQVMEEEHRDHAESLRRTRALTGDFTVPPEADEPWRALILGLQELECALMEHIHLENHVLFPRAAADESP